MPQQEYVEATIGGYRVTDRHIFPPGVNKLPGHVREEIPVLYDLLHAKPLQAVARLEALTEQYPWFPLFINYLCMAHTQAGNHHKARELSLAAYEKHPDYIFIRLNYAFLCLHEGYPERIPEIFAGKFDIRQLYPHRRVFHGSELISFSAVMAEYFHTIGDIATAEKYYQLMTQIAPDHRMTKSVKNRLHPSWLHRQALKLQARLERKQREADERVRVQQGDNPETRKPM